MTLTRPAPRYTLEKLQESYALSIPQAVNIMEKFGSEKDRIDRFMRRCDRHRSRKAGGTKSQT